MRKILMSAIILMTGTVFAQVPKKILVEHFTNTWCSICASRNPGFYANLANYPDILHVSYYPSSPYPGCILNQHNTQGNDGRTRLYGVYGSTPRLVIQGTVVSAAANYSSGAIFSPYLSQTSPFEISILQNKMNGMDMVLQIKIKAVAAHAFNVSRLYVAIAEDTLFYTGPNGEPMHLDVFRKALTDSNGVAVNVPSAIGDSLVLNFTTPIHSAWTPGKLLSMAVLQDENTHEVIQAEKTPAAQNDSILATGLGAMPDSRQLILMPNPVTDFIEVKFPFHQQGLHYKIWDASGRVILAAPFHNAVIDVRKLSPGNYFLKITSSQEIPTVPFQKR